MSRHNIVVIRSDGTVKQVECDEHPTLETLQSLIGGYIETVPVRIPVSDKPTMIVNEEGKLKGLPRNKAATKIARLYDGDYIAGDAVLLDANTEEFKSFTIGRAACVMQLVGVVAGGAARLEW